MAVPIAHKAKKSTTGSTVQDSSTDVLIIGGGLSGLTAAVGLIGSGLKVVILEGDKRLGGRAQSWTDSKTGDPVHIGPHIFLSAYHNMFSLLEATGTADKVIYQEDRFIRVFDGTYTNDSVLSDLPPPLNHVPGLLTDKTLSRKDMLSNMPVSTLAMQASEEDFLRLDNINAAAFLRSMGVTEHLLNRFWAFAAMSIMNVPLHLCSTGALLRFYKHLIGHRNVKAGFPDGGLGDIFAPQAQRLIEKAGGEIHLNTTVQRLVLEGDRVVGAVLTDGSLIRAKHVVAALPPHALRRLLPRPVLNMKPFDGLVAFEPCPYVSTYLWFDHSVTDLKFWARSFDANDLNCDFYDYANIYTDKKRPYSFITTNCIYCRRADDMSDEEMVQETLAELYENMPHARKARLMHSVVSRIPMAIHCPFPGTEQKRAPMESYLKGLLLAGDWTRTAMPSCMEGACYSGWKVAEHLWAEKGVQKSLKKELPPLEGLVGLSDKMKRSLHLPIVPFWVRPTVPARPPRLLPAGTRPPMI